MKDTIRAMVIAVAVGVLLPPGAPAGSLVEQQLATIRHVHLDVLAPRYEPLPGIPPEQLEQTLKERVAKILEQHTITVGTAQQELVLEIQVATSLTKDKPIALMVLLELQEPALLTREWAPGSNEEVVVTTWRKVWLCVASPDDVIEELFELVDLGTTHFAEGVRQARSAR